MIIEGCSKEEECCGGNPDSKHSLLKTKNLITLSVATSIDAIAVGVSIAMIGLSFEKIAVGTAMTFAASVLASLLGLLGGRCIGTKVGKRSEILGGIILIFLGAKILIEHFSL